MSVCYCTIPHFAAALARRDDPNLQDDPLVLIGPERQVVGVSAQAAACGVIVGMTSRAAEIRCPEARLVEADVVRYRTETEILFQLLEETSPSVEPHGWGAAYIDLGDMIRSRSDAAHVCQTIGKGVRTVLGDALQPALGWDSSKFTAQVAARQTLPGHLRAVDKARERAFLQPLPITLLPLVHDILQRLSFLGLRTLGQYAALPAAAVWQQFGRQGQVAQRCARGQDDRPILPRWQVPQREARVDFEDPVVDRMPLVATLERLVTPLLAELQANLQACGQVRLTVHFDDGSQQEQARTFLLPVAQQERVLHALEGLVDDMRWPAGATSLSVRLEQIQETVPEQLTLFARQDESQTKLREVQRYLTTRFGVAHLQRAVLSHPGAPLPEWRVGWLPAAEP